MTTSASRRRLLRLGLIAGVSIAAFVGVRRVIHPDFAARVKTDFIQSSRLNDDLSSLTPINAVELMSAFRQRVAYEVERLTPYGDALLFECGVYDWGQGEHFEFKITRQVVFPFGQPEEADDHIVQISLTLRYKPDRFRALTPVTQWDQHLPQGQSMRELVLSTPAYSLASAARPYEVALESYTQ